MAKETVRKRTPILSVSSAARPNNEHAGNACFLLQCRQLCDLRVGPHVCDSSTKSGRAHPLEPGVAFALAAQPLDQAADFVVRDLRRLGFEIEAEVADYDGAGEARVLLRKRLS